MPDLRYLTELDQWLLHALNGLAGRSYVADRVVLISSESNLIRLAPLVAALWWIWFSDAPPGLKLRHRVAAFAGVVGCTLTVALTRIMQNYLPNRPRPIHSDGLAAVVPFGVSDEVLKNWSAFPSDTAALAFALATAVWIGSRALGVLAIMWAAAVASLPRIFAGFHYPSDIVGGALIGIAAVLLVARLPATAEAVQRIRDFECRHRGVFCAIAFILTYQITTLFTDVRTYGQALTNLLEKRMSTMPRLEKSN